jgi:hypothetical protein
MEKLSDQVFRDLLDWYMCSDPWPVLLPRQPGGPRLTDVDSENHARITQFLDEQAKLFGFDNWVTAFHRFKI